MGGLKDLWKDITNPGWQQQEEANRLNAQAMNTQASEEAARRALAQEQANLAEAMIYGKGANSLPGVTTPTAEQQATGFYKQGFAGAKPAADEWLNSFLTFLKDAPDTTFNLQASRLQRQSKTMQDELARNMARRGLSTSGLNTGGMSSIDAETNRGLAELQGQRSDRKRQNLQTGAALTQEQLNNALNLYTGAKTGMMGLQSQIPGMLQTQATNAANYQPQQSPLAGLAGQFVKGKMDNWLSPSTVATQPTTGGSSGLKNIASTFLKLYGLGV